MPNFSEVAKSLSDSLHLALAPVSISFHDSIPDGVAPHSGTAPAGCRFWQEAASSVFATVPADHDLCAIGLYTHNLGISEGAGKDLNDALKVFGDLGYVRPDDMPFIPVLKRESKTVVYGPLGAVPAPPDVVLLFVKADQTLILSEVSQQLENGLPPAMGRPACAVVPQAFNTGRTALSLGCCGARAYLDALTPDMALYAIPGAKIEAFAARVVELSKANSILTAFHQLRRKQVELGGHPSVQDSLNAMQ